MNLREETHVLTATIVTLSGKLEAFANGPDDRLTIEEVADLAAYTADAVMTVTTTLRNLLASLDQLGTTTSGD